MKLVLFNQWEKLVGAMKALANNAAEDQAHYALHSVILKNGAATFMNRAMNVLTISGGSTRLYLPDIIPGKARDFLLRITANGSNTIEFVTLAEFESGEENPLAPPEDGQTIIYFFTETAGDKFLVARKIINQITGVNHAN